MESSLIIERTSPISGKTNRMVIDVTQEQIDAWQSGTVIQRAMPHLSADEREFILTGITAEEWDEMFGEEE